MSALPTIEPRAVAVVDANVLLDLHSCHNFSEEYEKIYATRGVAAIDDPAVVYRRARARESLLLAMYFNATGATTDSLGEMYGVLKRAVPPEEQSFELDYATLSFWFVKELLLPRWRRRGVIPASGWEAALSTPSSLDGPELVVRTGNSEDAWHVVPSGNRADAWHIAWAKTQGLPIVTNEGFTPSGYEQGKMAKRAAVEAVQVLFPKDVYAGRLDETAEIEGFFTRFREHAPLFLQEYPGHRRGLETMFGVLRHILLGETDGRHAPARVSIDQPMGRARR